VKIGILLKCCMHSVRVEGLLSTNRAWCCANEGGELEGVMMSLLLVLCKSVKHWMWADFTFVIEMCAMVCLLTNLLLNGVHMVSFVMS
jgi:hypothetical protein